MLGRTRIALLGAVFALGIAGCGGNDGTIPQDNSQQLLNMLTLLQNQVETGDCTLAEGTASQIDEAISKLPDSVDPDVQNALSKAAENLTELSKDPSQCDSSTTGAQGAQTTDTTSTTTTTTPTDTTSTPEPTPTTTSEGDDTEQPPPNDTPPGHQTPSPGNETPPGSGGNQTGGPRDNGGPATGGVTTPGGKR
jgi:hypothetical protein